MWRKETILSLIAWAASIKKFIPKSAAECRMNHHSERMGRIDSPISFVVIKKGEAKLPQTKTQKSSDERVTQAKLIYNANLAET